jgi:hypothetical protein
MFDYYRFIGSSLSQYLTIIESQCEMAGYSLRILSNPDTTDENYERITIIAEADVILDIYKG